MDNDNILYLISVKLYLLCNYYINDNKNLQKKDFACKILIVYKMKKWQIKCAKCYK